ARRCAELMERSLVTITALVPLIGYDLAAEVAKEAHAAGRSVREVVLGRGLLDEKEVDDALDLFRMTRGGLAGSE
ncbi:MAG: aspartate ammonia-lyase, partial [Actinomycetota bacterium]